ncbi:Magnesium transporter MRS2-4 [Citrus sinensis]|uniref:Magnesium transporter MRS2-4 n=1 Tax=Citrus sinensis TaxID=2711 RepID=A0ACB8K9W7_CITSI|nr:Magnesium transporter MRS2-4 [Citrus sinensis]
MGKAPLSFRRLCLRRRSKKKLEPPPSPAPPSMGASSAPTAAQNAIAGAVSAATGKGKKKAGGARLWMRFDFTGKSELVECDKSVIIERAGVPARDLRILGPVFSHSSNILAREKAMVVNLEFIKAIVTSQEVLLLDPLRQEVLPFVDQLRQQLPQRNVSNSNGAGPTEAQDNEMQVSTCGQWLPVPEAVEGFQCELPFEFQVLEIALEVVCTYLDSSVAELEKDAYPVLDELARNVSTKNLEHVRSLKSNLTRLLARVQKVRDEIEHLLDDNEDMAHLYLTRRRIQNQQAEALPGPAASNSIVPKASHLRRLSSNRSGSLVSSNLMDDNDVEDLEMLLEAYFMQLDGTRNKILSVREYIDDTEDYVNIQLDNQRNELIQLQLILTIASFAIAANTLIAGIFGMNIPCQLYETDGIFEIFVGSTTTACVLLFLLVLGYARWKKLLGT